MSDTAVSPLLTICSGLLLLLGLDAPSHPSIDGSFTLCIDLALFKCTGVDKAAE